VISVSFAPQASILRLFCREDRDVASRRWQVSVTRAKLYVDLNPSRDGKRKRTKVCINTVRYLGSASTSDGASHFTWVQASEGIAKLVVFG
jgi:hypothetical protein